MFPKYRIKVLSKWLINTSYYVKGVWFLIEFNRKGSMVENWNIDLNSLGNPFLIIIINI